MADYIEQAKAWVKANPDKAGIIGAFVAGFLLGALFF